MNALPNSFGIPSADIACFQHSDAFNQTKQHRGDSALLKGKFRMAPKSAENLNNVVSTSVKHLIDALTLALCVCELIAAPNP
jgi:hypothetical protein